MRQEVFPEREPPPFSSIFCPFKGIQLRIRIPYPWTRPTKALSGKLSILSGLSYMRPYKAATMDLTDVEIDLVGITDHHNRPTFELHSLARMPGML